MPQNITLITTAASRGGFLKTLQAFSFAQLILLLNQSLESTEGFTMLSGSAASRQRNARRIKSQERLVSLTECRGFSANDVYIRSRAD
jgi:hypothetical protein